jgi:hypothetical protein
MMNKEYKHGWHIAMEYDEFPLGLNEDIVRAISAVKEEPEWLLDFRLRAYRRWLTMEEPEWSDNRCLTAALCLVEEVRHPRVVSLVSQQRQQQDQGTLSLEIMVSRPECAACVPLLCY